SVHPEDVESWFARPERAVEVIEGVRNAEVLSDPSGRYEETRSRAKAFVWDEGMRRKANVWILARMVGWVEEVHKGVEGLRRDDPGRLLNARFGLLWGLARVLLVRHGILLSGDNTFLVQ
ncbi:MAG TPA: hypothetical protein VF168_12775, partial [Trueperaceae bacterium]